MGWVKLWLTFMLITAQGSHMMYYLMWRVMTGQHREIILSFLPVGHTKFFPDAGFGFKLTKVGCLDDIAAVVRSSATMNYAQLVGDQQGNVIVPSYNWIEHLEPHITKTALKGIKKMAHFRFSSDSPGYVFVKSSSDAIIGRKIKLLKDRSWIPQATSLPDETIPNGLSLQRQWYLYTRVLPRRSPRLSLSDAQEAAIIFIF